MVPQNAAVEVLLPQGDFNTFAECTSEISIYPKEFRCFCKESHFEQGFISLLCFAEMPCCSLVAEPHFHMYKENLLNPMQYQQNASLRHRHLQKT